ncbi:MAG: methyltransferase [Proteobacteria bacterium]|nr:methyltransferase [Pseudomonadota bacterium]
MSEPIEIFVLDKKVRLLQPADGFRTSLDSVMLAAACPARAGERTLDMGCGVGGASFCLLRRVPECHVTGIDIQSLCIELANQNKSLNNNTERCGFICGDVCGYNVENQAARFDHVICNPPYLEAGAHTQSPHEGKAVALGHEDASLQDWLDAGFRNLKSGGTFTIIHRADMTDKIIMGLGKRFGAIEIIPLWPRAGEAAKRVIIRAIKDRKTPATLHPGIVLHKEDGGYTPTAETILRGGKAL